MGACLHDGSMTAPIRLKPATVTFLYLEIEISENLGKEAVEAQFWSAEHNNNQFSIVNLQQHSPNQIMTS